MILNHFCTRFKNYKCKSDLNVGLLCIQNFRRLEILHAWRTHFFSFSIHLCCNCMEKNDWKLSQIEYESTNIQSHIDITRSDLWQTFVEKMYTDCRKPTWKSRTCTFISAAVKRERDGSEGQEEWHWVCLQWYTTFICWQKIACIVYSQHSIQTSCMRVICDICQNVQYAMHLTWPSISTEKCSIH